MPKTFDSRLFGNRLTILTVSCLSNFEVLLELPEMVCVNHALNGLHKTRLDVIESDYLVFYLILQAIVINCNAVIMIISAFIEANICDRDRDVKL